MFDRSTLLKRFRYKFEDEKLAGMLKEQIGATTTLGDAKLKTLLLLVMRNATTDSPWPVSNNPRAKYNDLARPDSNLHLPLWQLVRASTAAPTYFPPETIRVGTRRFVFVDGGVTMYNNPAFQLFLMSTLAQYGLCWETGVRKDAARVDRNRDEPQRQCRSHARRDESSLQRLVDPGGADARGARTSRISCAVCSAPQCAAMFWIVSSAI